MENKLKVLIVNDDGILAPGLQTLAKCVAEAGHEVCICAPNEQKSAASHSVTIWQPLIASRMQFPGIWGAWAVEGTPADCVRLALKNLAPDVDVVLSGINRGYNGGIDVLYSGTVSAAMEAAILGKRALAVSLACEREEYRPAAETAVRIMEKTMDLTLPEFSILNINYPDADIPRGIRCTPLRPTHYNDRFIGTELPDGRISYALKGSMDPIEEYRDDDYSWLSQGYVTVTVLHHDMTHAQMHDAVRERIDDLLL